MTDAEIFDLAMRPHGGRVAWERAAETPKAQVYAGIAEQAKTLIASARQFLPRLPEIHFDFIYNGKVNAVAFKYDGRYFIGVTSGAVVMLQLVLCRILADPLLLTHVGDPSAETADLPPVKGLVPDAQQMYESGALIPKPKNNARWIYSCRLLDQAALFLIGHEIAHITRGHVDYLTSITGSPFLEEVTWSQAGGMALIERQALEADADRRSVFSRIASIRLTAADKLVPPWSSAASYGPEELLFDWALATNVLFRLFGDIRFAGSDLTAASYPPLPLRRAMAMSAALALVKHGWDSALEEGVTKAVRRAMLETEYGFGLLTGVERSGAGMQDAFSPEGQEHVKRLSACWANGLRAQLVPFAYEELEPIDEPAQST